MGSNIAASFSALCPAPPGNQRKKSRGSICYAASRTASSCQSGAKLAATLLLRLGAFAPTFFFYLLPAPQDLRSSPGGASCRAPLKLLLVEQTCYLLCGVIAHCALFCTARSPLGSALSVGEKCGCYPLSAPLPPHLAPVEEVTAPSRQGAFSFWLVAALLPRAKHVPGSKSTAAPPSTSTETAFIAFETGVLGIVCNPVDCAHGLGFHADHVRNMNSADITINHPVFTKTNFCVCNSCSHFYTMPPLKPSHHPTASSLAHPTTSTPRSFLHLPSTPPFRNSPP